MPAVAIVLEDDPNMFWCGYVPNPAQPGGGCHIWKPGEEGRKHAVWFFDEPSARKAGVGAPNGPQGPRDRVPGRGVKFRWLYGDAP